MSPAGREGVCEGVFFLFFIFFFVLFVSEQLSRDGF